MTYDQLATYFLWTFWNDQLLNSPFYRSISSFISFVDWGSMTSSCIEGPRVSISPALQASKYLGLFLLVMKCTCMIRLLKYSPVQDLTLFSTDHSHWPPEKCMLSCLHAFASSLWPPSKALPSLPLSHSIHTKAVHPSSLMSRPFNPLTLLLLI